MTRGRNTPKTFNPGGVVQFRMKPNQCYDRVLLITFSEFRGMPFYVQDVLDTNTNLSEKCRVVIKFWKSSMEFWWEDHPEYVDTNSLALIIQKSDLYSSTGLTSKQKEWTLTRALPTNDAAAMTGLLREFG